jgi:HAD superfamily hydrolase (TIGR01509 family)
VQAVIFDLDGVLINSEPIWDAVRRGLASEHGRPWPDDATTAMQGMSTPEWSAYLAEDVGAPGTARELAEQVIDEISQRYATELPLITGARDAVQRLAGAFRLGLASSSPRRLIDAVLSLAGMTQFFEVSVSTEEVEAGKPSPAVYLEVARRMAVEPAEAAAVEDSSNGLRSAHAAGLAVIALPHDAFPPAPETLALASTTVATLDDLTVELFRSLR